ncbi:hypothetical protein Leryth_002719 [Lithospermum erythrorhizon]|nr:hypothetical protein Leryth_002719 [Lithospermum erythrorhizon]
MEYIKSAIFSLLILTFTTIIFTANASDLDILFDFLIPPNVDPAMITHQYFTFTGFRNLNKVNFTGKTAAIITKATKKEFPALDGQAVSVASILYPLLE